MSSGAYFHRTMDALRGGDAHYFTRVAPGPACGDSSIPFDPSVLIANSGPFWSPDPLLGSDDTSFAAADDGTAAPLCRLAISWRQSSEQAASRKLNWDSMTSRTSRELGAAIAFLIGLDVLSEIITPANAALLPASDQDQFAIHAEADGVSHRLQPDAALAAQPSSGSIDADGVLVTAAARTSLDPASTSLDYETAAWEGEVDGRSSTQTYLASALEPAGTREPALPDGSEPGASDAPGQLIVGGDGNDRLEGGAGHDTLIGGDGDDFLDGRAGSDTLAAGGGNDTLDGGTGTDVMIGGQGDDLYIVDNAGDLVVESADASGGIDTVQTTLGSYELGAGVENLLGAGASDFAGTGNDQDNLIASAAGNDELAGGAGNDTLLSGGGNDILDGGTGADRMAGGSGEDVYVVDNAGDIVVEAADGGTDTIVTTLDTYALGDALENLIYDGEGDFVGKGNTSSNSISGGGGNDELYGDWEAALANGMQDLSVAALSELIDGEADIIVLKGDGKISDGVDGAGGVFVGGKKNDTIVGIVGGNDTISGGYGNDTIDGGAGNDVLSGGWGNDVFVFRPGFGTDVITDFGSRGGNFDMIRLAGLGFTSFEEVASHISQVGSDTVLTLPAFEAIVLAGVDKMTLALEDQFIF